MCEERTSERPLKGGEAVRGQAGQPAVATAAPKGTLFLIVGPSGAGKDTLLAGARRALADDPRYVFPARFITRPVSNADDDGDANDERHIAITPGTFAREARWGAFALHWHAHGLHYAIPAAINEALRAGRHVIINVSRCVIEQARAAMPGGVTVIYVDAPRPILAARLAARGREPLQAIEARLARQVDASARTDADHVIVNDGTPDEGAAALTALLEQG